MPKSEHPKPTTTTSKLVHLENVKHIKHAPPKPYSYTETNTVVHVKSSTPFISAVKRIEKNLAYFEEKYNKKGRKIPMRNKDVQYITVKGMGKAVLKVLNLAVHFKYEKDLKTEIHTKTIGVIDEFKKTEHKEADDSEDEDDDDLLRKRNVSSVEVKIFIPERV